MESKDDDFELWFAELRLKEAKNQSEVILGSLENIKMRASSILGLSVTLSVASAGVAFSNNNHYVLATLILSLGFFITACLCVKILFSTPWNYEQTFPKVMDAVYNEVKGSKVETLWILGNTLDFDAEKNLNIVEAKRQYLIVSWKLLIITPLMAAVFLV